MDNTGILDTLNRYITLLTKTVATQKVNKLRKMCILPFLKDIYSDNGRLRAFVTPNDKILWNNFASRCFQGIGFEAPCWYNGGSDSSDGASSSTVAGNVYVGTGNYLPTPYDIIPSKSVSFSPEARSLVGIEKVTGVYFWIAVPYGLSVTKVTNVSFSGDTIPMEAFTKVVGTIDNTQYNIYYRKTTIPLLSQYKITIR